MELKYYLKKAQKEGWAIGQFNFSTPEQLRGILDAAESKKSPVILGTSESESKFFGLKEVIALVEILKTRHKISVFLHLDHGKDVKFIKEAIDFGYQSVHFDGSDLILAENTKKTKEVADYAHKKEVLVEGELGYIRGESAAHKEIARISKEELTRPEDVDRFVNETKVDSLAVSIGTIHGIYLREPELDFERLKQIRSKTNAFLVLHGGSGVPEKEIKEAVKFGIVKININTELRMVWKQTLEKFFRRNPQEIKPYKILVEVQEETKKKVTEKIALFGSQNKI